MSCLRYLCLFTHSGVQPILCCVFALIFFFLWIVLFCLPLRYSRTFIFPSGSHQFTSSFCGIRIDQSFALFVCLFFPRSVQQIVVCHLSFIFCHCIYFQGLCVFLSRYFFLYETKSDYVFSMTYPYYFPGFTNFFCCILKVIWLFRMHFKYY